MLTRANCGASWMQPPAEAGRRKSLWLGPASYPHPTGSSARACAREGANEIASLGGNWGAPWARKATVDPHSGGLFEGARLHYADCHLATAYALPGRRSRQRFGVTTPGRTGTERQQRPAHGRCPDRSSRRLRGDAASGVLTGQHGGRRPPADTETLLRRDSVVMPFE